VTREDRLEVAVLRRVVSSEAELAEMLADAAGSGGAAVLLEEIVAAAEAQAPDEGELKEAFAVFDADGDGRISAEELMAVLASLGDDDRCSVEDCRRMIGGVDADGDGFVCFDDFTRMMTQGL
jgi:calcium-binding protein CML